jgi:hypothetical protein
MTEVYVPVSFAEGDAPAYVFETYRDFTPFKARVDRLTRESSLTLGLLLLFALLLSVGVINVNRRLERRIMVLEELLPICASCKKVRVEGEGGAVPQWVAVEEYLHHRAEVDFTHGICPDCGRRYYGHHYDNIVNRKQQST